MKIGDLVELSGKGNGIHWCAKFQNQTGIVVDFKAKDVRLHSVQVMWLGKGSWWIHRTYLKVVSRG